MGTYPLITLILFSGRVLKGAAVEVPSDMNDFFVADNMVKIRHELFLIRQRKKEKKKKK